LLKNSHVAEVVSHYLGCSHVSEAVSHYLECMICLWYRTEIFRARWCLGRNGAGQKGLGRSDIV